MPRYKLTVEYDGRPFCGWQRQANALSVQQVLEEAIARFSGESVTIQAAGRTDAGVHALGQVVSFDLSREWDPFRIREALNYHTKPHPVAIVEAARCRGRLRGPVLGHRPALRVSHPQPPGPGGARGRRVWHVPVGSMPRRCMRRRSSFSVGTTSPPFAPPSARPTRRSARWTAFECRGRPR
jgi:tRNA pseudouridine38-40 synthase